MTGPEKTTATIELKDQTTSWFGYYRVRVTHLPRYALRVVIIGSMVGLVLVFLAGFNAPAWARDDCWFMLGWLGLELLLTIISLASRAAKE